MPTQNIQEYTPPPPLTGRGLAEAQASWLQSGNYSREQARAMTMNQLRTLGREEYMNLYPELFTPGEFMPRTHAEAFPYRWGISQEIGDLKEVKDMFGGPEGSFIRWLVDRRIGELTNKLRNLQGLHAEYNYEPEPPPIPDWMQPYIQPTGEGPTEYVTTGKPSSAARGKLRPLGAQEELTPEQMGEMAGYQAWQQAGAPTQYSTEALERMADWERWWEPYTRLSESIFPKQQRFATRWRPAEQR